MAHQPDLQDSGPQRQDVEHADDRELLALYLSTHNSRFLEELILRHYEMVKGVIVRRLGREEDVADALQTTFLVFIKSAHSIRNRNSIASWLYGVAHRTCMRIGARLKRAENTYEASAIDSVDTESESPFSVVAKKMQLDVLDQELHAVKNQYREVLVEHYLLGHSAAQIAAQFNISQSTVEGRLRRGRAELRARMLRRGYSFSMAIFVLNSLPRTSLSAEATDFATGLLENPFEASTLSDTVSHLITEELKMAVYLTSKTSIFVGTATLAIIGALAINTHGFQSANGTASQSGQSQSTTLLSAAPSTNQTPVRFAAAQSVASVTQSTPVNNPERSALPDWAQKTASSTGKALDSMDALDYDWYDVPLTDVMASISDDLGIPIWIDAQDLENIGLPPDYPITFSMPPMPLHQALRMMLSQHDLDYRLDADVLVIGSTESIGMRPSLRVFDLSTLADPPSEQAQLQEALLKTLRTLQPDMWENEVWHATPVGQSVVVSASDATHRQFAQMCTDLGQQLGRIPKQRVIVDKIPRQTQSLRNNTGADDPFGNSPPAEVRKRRKASADPFGSSTSRSDDPFGNGN